jgi:hypothetical protein
MLVSSLGSKAVLETPLTGAVLRTLKDLPGTKKWQGSRLVFEPTPEALKFIERSFPGVQWSDDIQPALDAALYLEVHRKATTPVARPDGFRFKTTPYEHQRRAFLMSRDLEAFALFMEQGTGKTKVLIDTAAHQWAQGKIDALLVVAPNGVHRNWVDNELPVHMPDWVKWKAHWWKAPSSASKTHVAKWDEAANHDGLAVLCINVEALSHKATFDYIRGWMRHRRVMMVVDESTRIKEMTSNRTKNVLKMGEYTVSRRIATGTPVAEGPLDLFPQFYFLDQNMLGFPNFQSFKSTFAILQNVGDKTFDRWVKNPVTGKNEKKAEPIQMVVGYRDVDHLQSLVEPHSFRVLKTDCLDLPEKVYTKWPVELSKEQQRIYNELKTQLWSEVKGQLITAPMVMTKLMRFRQTIGGFPEGVVLDDQPRIAAMIEWAKSFPKTTKAIIWAAFRPELDAIATALREAFPGEGVSEYHGGIPAEIRANGLKAFQTNPDFRWFVANGQSAGVGLTLTSASQVGYYSNHYSLELRLQSEDRAHRIGQRNPVTYTDFIAPGTIEDKVVQALRDKKNLADTITGDELLSWI